MNTVRTSLPIIALMLIAIACQNFGGGSSKKKDGVADAPRDDGLVWTSRAYPTGDRATSALLWERVGEWGWFRRARHALCPSCR